MQKATDFITYLLEEIVVLESQAHADIDVIRRLNQIKLPLKMALEDAEDDVQSANTICWAVQVEIEKLKTPLNGKSSQANASNRGLLGDHSLR